MSTKKKVTHAKKAPKDEDHGSDSHLYETKSDRSDSRPDASTAHNFPEIKVMAVSKEESLITDKGFVVVGSADAGKSTLIGTLTSGILDNGRGSARVGVARHQHEIDAGKTSDISTRVLRFPNGKTATLIDLCGQDKYFTTTASGISGMWPDYAIVVISPTRGIVPMTRQHFKMLMSYNIPVLVVVTRVDMALEESCKITDRDIKELCKTYKRTTEFMNSYAEYHAYARGTKLIAEHKIDPSLKNISDEDAQKLGLTESDVKDISEALNFETSKMTSIGEINQGLKMAGGKQTYIPVVYVSNVDGYCLDVVKQAMMTVEPRELWSNDENANSIVKFFRTKLALPKLGLENTHVGSTFYIDNAYTVKGVGLVISGINRGDPIGVNDELFIGPIAKTFVRVKLRSMHNDNREPIEQLANHHRGCIAIKCLKEELKKNQICRGMVMISKAEMLKNVCYRFEAAVTIFGGHSATLRTGYSPVVHAGTIRQAAKLILPDENLTDEEQAAIAALSKRERKEKAQKKIKSGDVERVTFKFRIRPEYLDPGTVFVFRSGDIHGVGCVISVVSLESDTDAQPEPLKKKFRKIRPSDLVKEREMKAQIKPAIEKVVVKEQK